MSTLLSLESTILIVGAGTWGISTALHLKRSDLDSLLSILNLLERY
jgi:thioredoxin reductase